MLSKFHTVYEGGEAEIIEKKSRFIATVLPVTCEEEALEFIESMKKKYWNATHNCYAYVIGERFETQRCSDDGEPQGTAGKPILDVLLGGGDTQYSSRSDKIFWRYVTWNRRACEGLFRSSQSRIGSQ